MRHRPRRNPGYVVTSQKGKKYEPRLKEHPNAIMNETRPLSQLKKYQPGLGRIKLIIVPSLGR